MTCAVDPNVAASMPSETKGRHAICSHISLMTLRGWHPRRSRAFKQAKWEGFFFSSAGVSDKITILVREPTKGKPPNFGSSREQTGKLSGNSSSVVWSERYEYEGRSTFGSCSRYRNSGVCETQVVW